MKNAQAKRISFFSYVFMLVGLGSIITGGDYLYVAWKERYTSRFFWQDQADALWRSRMDRNSEVGQAGRAVGQASQKYHEAVKEHGEESELAKAAEHERDAAKIESQEAERRLSTSVELAWRKARVRTGIVGGVLILLGLVSGLIGGGLRIKSWNTLGEQVTH